MELVRTCYCLPGLENLIKCQIFLLLATPHEQPGSLSYPGIGLYALLLVVVSDGISGNSARLLEELQYFFRIFDNCNYGPSRSGAGMEVALPVDPKRNPGFIRVNN
jgi:hypothetical protein